jgi:hypothetical protein
VILVTPAVPPVTTPVVGSTAATVALLLVHVPPDVVDERVELAPEQIEVVPENVPGVGFTVRMAVLTHPVDVSVKFITELPASNAVRVPVVAPIMPTEVLLLVQVPAPDELVRVVVEPEQRVSEPPIAAGSAITVTVRVAIQPSVEVKVIVVVPAVTPVAIPVEEPMPAIVVFALLQVPEAVLLSVVEAPSHIEAVPLMAGGSAFTVITLDADAVPQLLDMVYVIDAVPTEDPDTTPVVKPTGATDALPLIHVPPTTVLDNVIVEPLQTADGPLKVPADADVVTVTSVVVVTVPHAPFTV